MPKLNNALQQSHATLATIVNSHSNVIDATVGNGHDTLFLTQLANNGTVYGFDIQQAAINNTTKLLEKHQIANAHLFNTGHENIDQMIAADVKIDAAIFNLGYLPGGDKTVITTKESTIAAIEQCLARLNQFGVVILVTYYGHDGGPEEKNAVMAFCQQLDQKVYGVSTYQFINQKHNPPILITIQKISD